MTVGVRLPKELRRLYGVPHPATVAGATVREVLSALDAAHPGVGHRLVDGGRLRRHVIVFVGDDQAGLDDPVPSGAHITVLTAVAGGSASPAHAGEVAEARRAEVGGGGRGRANTYP